MEHTKGEINMTNFFRNTRVKWNYAKVPEDEPDYISDSFSKYWFFKDGVIRLSDHWLTNIGSCIWNIDEDLRFMLGMNDYNAGFAKWKDFKLIAIKEITE